MTFGACGSVSETHAWMPTAAVARDAAAGRLREIGHRDRANEERVLVGAERMPGADAEARDAADRHRLALEVADAVGLGDVGGVAVRDGVAAAAATVVAVAAHAHEGEERDREREATRDGDYGMQAHPSSA